MKVWIFQLDLINDHQFEKLNKILIIIFELNFYQGKNKWKHKLIPIEISKIDWDRFVDLLIYKNHYAISKKLNVFLGDQQKIFICRQCLNSYTSENMLTLQKPKCEICCITTIRTSSEWHLHWKEHFHKNSLYLSIFANFEADNKIGNSDMGNQTTNINKQNAVVKGYYIVSESNDVSKSGYYESLLGCDDVDWFVDAVHKLKNEMAFHFQNTKKHIIRIEKDEEENRNKIICRLCEKNIESDKVRDQWHLTGKHRGPAHSKCNIFGTQDKCNIISFVCHNFRKYDCHMFFKKVVDKNNDKVKFDIIPTTNEEYISVTYGWYINTSESNIWKWHLRYQYVWKRWRTL